MKRIKDTDYLYISARVRVMETRLLTRERMERMIDARDAAEAAKVLVECGYPEMTPISPDGLEAMLAAAQADLFQDLGEAVKNKPLLDVFRCRWDYHNAKVLVKAEKLGVNQDRLLLGGGRYDPAELADSYRRGDLSRCSETFQAGVSRAREVLGTSGDPQQADFILDRTWFAELAELAKASGSTFLEGYAALFADTANLRAAVRAARLDRGPDFLRQVLVPGGTVSLDALSTARGNEVDGLFKDTLLKEAAEMGASLAEPGAGPLTDFERLCDDALMAYFGGARQVPFGVEPVIGYLYAREAEASAIRIIMGGRMAGLDRPTIRSRLRRCYA